jgi:hypothetical protein
MDALTARVEDGLLQQCQHIAVRTEHDFLTAGDPLRLMLQAQIGEGHRVNLVRDGAAQA